MTWRRLGVLIEHSPDDSALTRQLKAEYGDDATWSRDQMLMAEAVDRIGLVAYLLGGMMRMWADRGAKNPLGEHPPPRIPRPGVTAKGDGGSNRKGTGMRGLVKALGAPIE